MNQLVHTIIRLLQHPDISSWSDVTFSVWARRLTKQNVDALCRVLGKLQAFLWIWPDFEAIQAAVVICQLHANLITLPRGLIAHNLGGNEDGNKLWWVTLRERSQPPVQIPNPVRQNHVSTFRVKETPIASLLYMMTVWFAISVPMTNFERGRVFIPKMIPWPCGTGTNFPVASFANMVAFAVLGQGTRRLRLRLRLKLPAEDAPNVRRFLKWVGSWFQMMVYLGTAMLVAGESYYVNT
jgi:hypothetical protein